EFPGHLRHQTTDVIVVHSARYPVGAPPFRAAVARLVRRVQATGDASGTRSYLTSSDPTLVSRDRHATMIPIAVLHDDDIKSILSVVGAARGHPAFAVSITGLRSLNHDFNQLSQDDLKSGELEFGLPAALLVLLL